MIQMVYVDGSWLDFSERWWKVTRVYGGIWLMHSVHSNCWWRNLHRSLFKIEYWFFTKLLKSELEKLWI